VIIRCLFLVLVTNLCVSAQEDYGVVLNTDRELSELNRLLEKYQGYSLDTISKDVIPGEVDIPFSFRNAIYLDHYQQSLAGDTISSLPAAQTTIRSENALGFLGVGLSLRTAVILNNNVLDRGRSGVSLSFDRKQLLDQLKGKHLEELPKEQQAYLKKLGSINPRVSGAIESLTFDRYLEVINSKVYAAAYKTVMAKTDSLVTRPLANLNESEKALLKQRKQLEDFTEKYRQLLHATSRQPAKVRMRAQAIVDSCLASIKQINEERIRQSVIKNGETSFVQKLLLLSEGFTLGNTRLAVDETISAGLPIRGVDYIYNHNLLRISFRHGRRIRSDRFLPSQGIAYHDRLGNMRLTQGALEIERNNGSKYKLTGLIATELPEVSQGSGAHLLRTNQVMGIHSITSCSKRVALLADVHHATTTKRGLLPTQDNLEVNGPLQQLSIKLGANFNLPQGALQMGVFYRGENFTSFANPYLITDFKGAFARFNVELFDNFLYGDFSLELGNGTQDATSDNTRIQARGALRANLTPKLTAAVMVSPNTYRYEVSNQQGFSENSIYRAEVIYRAQIKRQAMVANVSLTNLDMGWTWNDSTTVTKSALLRASLTVPTTDRIAITADGQWSINSTENKEWFHALTVSYGTRARLQLGLRYDKYRNEAQGAFAGTLNAFLPLGKHITLNANLYYRPQSGPSANMNPTIFQSHQALEGRY